MGPQAVQARLRRVAELADLDPARRLDAKIDYSVDAVSRRLRAQAMLRESCRKLGQRGGAGGAGGDTP